MASVESSNISTGKMKTNMNIKPEIKKQFSKVFLLSDWRSFKLMADYYFETSAKILKKDIGIADPYKLMGRNIQKRLFIGIGTELLLKSLFLKNNYCINRVKKNKSPDLKVPIIYTDILDKEILNPADTFTLNTLIENISKVIISDNLQKLLKGLKIAKVFRNKEGHVVVLWHIADRQNYTDIEDSIIEIYNKGFNQKLNYKISFLEDEIAKFEIG